jgi:hypothetical protein
LRAADPEPLGPATFVDDLDDDRRVARLLQHRWRRTPLDSHARFRIDVHREQHTAIEQLLQGLRIARLPGFQETRTHVGGERRAQEVESDGEPLDVGCERLPFDHDSREARGRTRRRPARHHPHHVQARIERRDEAGQDDSGHALSWSPCFRKSKPRTCHRPILTRDRQRRRIQRGRTG